MSDERRDAWDARLDLAIDRAVREMLDVEPRAGLRARVVALIETRRFVNLRVASWIMIPLAAAAVLILAILPPRQTHPSVQPQPPVVAARGATLLPGRHVPAPALAERLSPAAAPVSSSRRQHGRATAADVAGPAPGDDTSSNIEALAPIAPITIAPVRPRSIAPSEIAVAPLTPIPEIQVSPLFPPDRRD
jgi:hypothetical protein